MLWFSALIAQVLATTFLTFYHSHTIMNTLIWYSKSGKRNWTPGIKNSESDVHITEEEF